MGTSRSATRTPRAPSDIEFVDAVVVGSGFGGATAAYRLAEGGRSVVVLERGRAYPPGSFARSPADFSRNFWSPGDGLFGLIDAWSFSGLEGVVSAGLGGGSLLYANVLLRKDPEWFVHDSPIPGGGYENWPISRDDLEPHYDRVERMLGGTRYPYRDTPRTVAFEAAAASAGYETVRPPIAVTFAVPGEQPAPLQPLPAPEYGNIHGATRLTCALCGECDLGCNYGAKNTLDHTYLSAAAHHGASVRPLHKMRGFRPLDDGAWEVRYVSYDPDDPDAPESPPRIIRCSTLVLAMGTLATGLHLLRNRAAMPGLSAAVGSRFSGNGDLLGVVLGARESLERGAPSRRIAPHRGTVITSMVRVGDRVDGDGSTGRGFYIEDAGFPTFLHWLIETGQFRSVVSRTTRVALSLLASRLSRSGRTSISRDLARALGNSALSDSSLALLGMGRDIPDGKMFLDRGNLAIDWNVSTSLDYFSDVREAMRRIADNLDAGFADNPLWRLKRVITVHPLGGAPMGRGPHEGVVDRWGEVFGYPGLYVLDGSAMPGAVGPNPAMTIAAFSDRGAEHILETTTTRARPTAPVQEAVMPQPRPSFDGATSVSFTEQMKGFFALGDGDPESAVEDARVRDERMMFELTITAEDVDRFLIDEAHEGSARGYLHADALGGRFEVLAGWFNLFVQPGGRDTRRMRYRLWFETPGGAPMTFVGYKDVQDDPGFDLWSDTTTLYVQVLNGHIGQGETDDVVEGTGLLPPDDPRVTGAGVLRIKALDFARQLSTFRAEGPAGAAAIGRFGSMFLGQLWSVYRGPAREAPR